MGPKVETEAILRHALGENVTDEKQKEKGNERKCYRTQNLSFPDAKLVALEDLTH